MSSLNNFKIVEKPKGHIDLSFFKGMDLGYIWMRITRHDGLVQSYRRFKDNPESFDVSDFVGDKHFYVTLRAKACKKPFRATDVKVEREKTIMANPILIEFSNMMLWHIKRAKEHKERVKKAAMEQRYEAKKEHEEAAQFHQSVADRYITALDNKDVVMATELQKLTVTAKLHTQEAYDADQISPEPPKKGWFKERGVWVIQGKRENSLDGRPAVISHLGNSLGFAIPYCKKIFTLEYQTDRRTTWTPVKALQLTAHVFAKIPSFKNFNLRIRVNEDDSAIFAFFIPPLPVKFDMWKALQKAYEKSPEGKVKNTLHKILEDKKEEIKNHHQIMNAIKSSALNLTREKQWEVVKPLLPPSFREARPGHEKLFPKAWGVSYKIPPWSVLEDIIALSKVNERTYNTEDYNCSDYCFSLRTELRDVYKLNCAIVVISDHKKYGSNHCFLILLGIEDDGTPTAKVFEPQRDEFISPEETHQGQYILQGAHILYF